MADITDPQDAAAFVNATTAMPAALAELRGIAEPLGYFVEGGVSSELGDRRVHQGPLGTEPHTWFRVYRFDQPDRGRTFDAADDVRGHLGTVKGWPRYALAIKDDPHTDAGGKFTVTDAGTGVSFLASSKAVVRQPVTQLVVHAEEHPDTATWNLLEGH